MKILHVINNLERGGAETMLIKLINYNNSDDIFIFNLIGKNNYEIFNKRVRIFTFNFKSRNFFNVIYNLFRLIYYVYQIKPNKIIFWLYHSFIFSVFLKFFYISKVDHFWNIRQVIPDFRYEKKTTKYIFHICKIFSFIPKKIIYNSYEAKNLHIKSGFKKDNSIYIPNGFQEKLIFNNISKKIHDKLKNKFVVALFARYHLSKGHDLFLKSIKQISNINHDMIFILAGKNVNYNNKNLTDIICYYKIREHVILLDELANVDDYLRHVNLLVNCSKSSEGFPNIIGEAIMNNCICVASNISDNKYILKNEKLIINNLNERSLSKKILEIYNLSVEEKKKIATNLKKHFIDNYSLNKIVEMYDKILN